jgi:hypothetical protein
MLLTKFNKERERRDKERERRDKERKKEKDLGDTPKLQ